MVNFMDASDVSQDGEHVVLVAGAGTGTVNEDVFDYDFVTNTKGSIYTTTCTGIVNSDNNECLHKTLQTADNNVLISFAGEDDSDCPTSSEGAEQGYRLWESGSLTAVQDCTNHVDTGYDLSGNSIFVEQGGPYYLPGETNPCTSGWGLDVRRLIDLTAATCLIDIDEYGSLEQWHVSYRGSTSQPWVALSFFDNRTSTPEWFSTSANYSNPSSNWLQYEDEILLVRIDAANNSSKIYRLARAYSRSNENYWAQPRAAISRDGKYVIFDSNMAHPGGCPSGVYDANDCSDVYIIKVQ